MIHQCSGETADVHETRLTSGFFRARVRSRPSRTVAPRLTDAGGDIADGMHDASAALAHVEDEVRKLGEAIGHKNGNAFAQRTRAWTDALDRRPRPY